MTGMSSCVNLGAAWIYLHVPAQNKCVDGCQTSFVVAAFVNLSGERPASRMPVKESTQDAFGATARLAQS